MVYFVERELEIRRHKPKEQRSSKDYRVDEESERSGRDVSNTPRRD